MTFLDLYSKGRAKYHDLIRLFSVEETIFVHIWVEKCSTCGGEAYWTDDLVVADIQEQGFVLGVTNI